MDTFMTTEMVASAANELRSLGYKPVYTNEIIVRDGYLTMFTVFEVARERFEVELLIDVGPDTRHLVARRDGGIIASMPVDEVTRDEFDLRVVRSLVLSAWCRDDLANLVYYTRNDKKIQAVITLRRLLGVGLKEAKDLYEFALRPRDMPF